MQQERNVSISRTRCVSRDTNGDGITQTIIRIRAHRAATFM
jgi:AraC-like DNA-binding protein